MRLPPLPRTLWLLIFLGALLRIGFIELRPSGAMFIAPDEPEYFAIAEGIASGSGFSFYGEPTAYRDLLFPAMAGGIIAIFGSEHAVFYFQLLLDLITALLLFLIARRWFTEEIALVTAGAWLLYPSAIIFTSLFLTETLFVFLWVLALWIYSSMFTGGDPGSRRPAEGTRAALLGLVLGLLLLTRATGIILVLAILFHLAFRRCYRPILVLLPVIIAVILPWMLRNAAVMGAFSLNTNSGINLYQGSNPHATGAYRFDEPVTAPLEFNRLNEVERNQRATQLSFDYLRSHPVDALSLWPRKFAYFWSTDVTLWAHYLPRPDLSLAQQVRSVPIILLAVTGLTYILFVIAGAAGLILSKNMPLRGMFFGQLLLATLSAVATYGLARYHYPLMPALLLLGAGALHEPRAWRDARAIRRAYLIILLVILTAIWLAEAYVIATG